MIQEKTDLKIRLVGLSATLPNFKEIGEFIGAKEDSIFFFNSTFRPVPL